MLVPIAHIETDFKEKFGLPRQGGRVKSLMGRIVFEKAYRDSNALRGLEGFSHLWLLFDFSEAHREEFTPTVRPPRLGGNRRVGVFASRSPYRPNSIGLTAVKLEKICAEQEGTVLYVSGVDLLSGTPIYDIKPYLPFSDCIADARGGFAEEQSAYRLEVVFEEALLALIPEEKREALCDCLAEDPRPSYQDDGREYKMDFAGNTIRFSVSQGVLSVLGVEPQTAE